MGQTRPGCGAKRCAHHPVLVTQPLQLCLIAIAVTRLAVKVLGQTIARQKLRSLPLGFLGTWQAKFFRGGNTELGLDQGSTLGGPRLNLPISTSPGCTPSQVQCRAAIRLIPGNSRAGDLRTSFPRMRTFSLSSRAASVSWRPCPPNQHTSFLQVYPLGRWPLSAVVMLVGRPFFSCS